VSRNSQLAFLLALGILAVHARAAAFHFAILSDRTGRAQPGVYEEAWKEIAAAKPAFVITVGDSIEGLDDARARAEWESLKRIWPPRIPLYQTPGNHDIWDQFSEDLFVEETGSKPFYSFDFQQAHFVVLDNSRTDDLAPAQLQFLENDLKRHRGAASTMIFFHRPFWLIPLKLGMNGFRLHQLAREYGVCCVLSGHGHQLQSVERDGVLYLEAGSSGQPRTRGSSRNRLCRGLVLPICLRHCGWQIGHIRSPRIRPAVRP
jgi:predicted phosphodiesterase